MRLIWTLETFRWSDVPDVLVVAAIIFAAAMLMRGTQAIPLLRGTIVVLLVIAFFATALDWVAFRWLLNNLITAAAFAIPVIFQPELRRALERVGRAGLGTLFSRAPSFTEHEQIIDAICAAASRLSERRHGALIVLERNDSLDEFIQTGVPLDSAVSPQLFLTVFWPKTELHDGAVIIRNGRVASAASVLPLSSGRNLTDRKLGTRHRAGLGISEVSDALCVIVSEETGRISVANRGRMIRRLDANRLRTILNAFYTSPAAQSESPWSSLIARARDELARLRSSDKPDQGRKAA
ncbi:MAG TPA: diadenylate cyclase CdaA [Aggregatilinea sp.]|jgi:diadenylate cyclase|uniref:diadenylate cyclase CdaA n=1 Tax=Aggregatilinea sp. TaxID=2806333 RepID=UPI002B81B7B7|nr:diadenylate cyclase CdaA [Aggregatilinea sp.]HML23371.1 diadenylate cyclase CdaA [Aggregatilinea sp.]